MDAITSHLEWVVAGLIVLLGLVLYGFGDLVRISLLRIRAVASVCFRESIRRRVLWLTPLAILGVLVVAQFQRPLDEQDAIRQVTKFCIFASGILITISAVILACTNLPREIENRVIYTVVTKPTSRLEILLGKIAGFAAVSALTLVIMGVFTWGYLQLHEWRVMRTIDARVEAGGLEPASEATLKYYQKNGLLDARRYVTTGQVQVFPEYPKKGTEIRVIEGPNEQEALVPFVIDEKVLPPGSSFAGLALVMKLPWEQRPLTNEELLTVASMAEASGVKADIPAPVGPGVTTGTDLRSLLPAFFQVSFVDEQINPLIDQNLIHNGTPMPAADRAGQQPIQVPLSTQAAEHIVNARRFYVRVKGNSPGTRYAIDPANFAIVLATEAGQVAVQSKQFDPTAPANIIVMGRATQNGQQVAGNVDGKGGIGVFTFSRPDLDVQGGEADFEFRSVIERDTDDLQAPMWADFRVINQKTGQTSDVVRVAVESRRTAHFSLPVEYTKGGDFDVLVQAMSNDQWLSVRPGALRLSSVNHGFGLNLVKSFVILWLFSVLVIVVAIFCSTFLSWPIAFVLTLLILLGHWGVAQLGDLAKPGVGRQVVSDLFTGAAPAVAETLNRSVEGLGALLRVVSAILPDVSRFAAMADIEQGIAISADRIIDPLLVLALFGLPILTLSYVFFRNKEVAP